MRRSYYLALLILINLMWATQYPATKVAVDHAGPITVNFWMLLFACLTLYPIRLHEKRKLKRNPSRPIGNLRSKVSWLRFSLLSVAGILIGSIALNWGIDRSLAMNGSLLALAVPIQMIFLAGIMLRERITWVHWISLFLALAGVLITSDFDWKNLDLFHGKYLFGNILIFAAGLGSSFYNTYAKRLLETYTPIQILLYGYVIAVFYTIPLLAWHEPAGLKNFLTFGASTWFSLIVLGVFAYGLGTWLFFWLMERYDVSQLSISIYLLPLFGVIVTAMTLKEKFTLSMLVGGSLVLLGNLLVGNPKPPREEKPELTP